jgi:hypothetical protein
MRRYALWWIRSQLDLPDWIAGLESAALSGSEISVKMLNTLRSVYENAGVVDGDPVELMQYMESVILLNEE